MESISTSFQNHVDPSLDHSVIISALNNELLQRKINLESLTTLRKKRDELKQIQHKQMEEILTIDSEVESSLSLSKLSILLDSNTLREHKSKSLAKNLPTVLHAMYTTTVEGCTKDIRKCPEHGWCIDLIFKGHTFTFKQQLFQTFVIAVPASPPKHIPPYFYSAALFDGDAERVDEGYTHQMLDSFDELSLNLFLSSSVERMEALSSMDTEIENFKGVR